MPPTLWLAVAVVYAVASLITFVWYGLDKRAARRGERRTPERTLHVMELLGGWPGALAAQRCFRHKTRDPGFRRAFLAIVTLHALGWTAFVFLWLRTR